MVDTRPMFLVCAASLASGTDGARDRNGRRKDSSPTPAWPSARKMPSSLPRSASLAISMKVSMSVDSFSGLGSVFQDAL
jgi:hypothetical protein